MQREPDPSDIIESLPTTMEGLMFFAYRHYNWKNLPPQLKYLKYSLARLCRMFPEENPREFLVEFFAALVYEYERTQEINYGKHIRYALEYEHRKNKEVRQRVRKAIQELEEKYEKHNQEQTQEGASSTDIPKLDDRIIAAIERGWNTP